MIRTTAGGPPRAHAAGMAMILTASLLGACLGKDPPTRPIAQEDAVEIPRIEDTSRIDPSILEPLAATLRAVEENPTEAGAWGALGRLYHGTEYLTLARRCYVEAARRDPDDVEWPYLIALLDVDRGRLSSAGDWIARARRVAPGDALTERLAGELLLQQNDLAAAEAILTPLSREDPATLDALATVYLRQHRVEDARRMLEGAVATGIDDRATLFLLATALRRLGEDNDADRVLQRWRQAPARQRADARLSRVRSEAPGTPMMLRRAAAHFAGGELERAETLYRQILEAHPDDFVATLNLANVLGRQGRSQEALPLMENAVEWRPDDTQAHLGLAMAYGSLGRLPEARAELREILRIDPDNETARRLLSGLP